MLTLVQYAAWALTIVPAVRARENAANASQASAAAALDLLTERQPLPEPPPPLPLGPAYANALPDTPVLGVCVVGLAGTGTSSGAKPPVSEGTVAKWPQDCAGSGMRAQMTKFIHVPVYLVCRGFAKGGQAIVSNRLLQQGRCRVQESE
jgi:hypothetical protein